MTACTAAAAEPDVATLLAKWHPFITREAGRIARRLGLDVDDVIADVCLAVLEDWQRFDPARAGFSTWLGYVIRGVRGRLAWRTSHSPTTLNVRPDQGRHRGEDPGDPLTARPDPHPQPDEAAETSERVQRVRQALAALPEADADLLLRRFGGGTLARAEAKRVPRLLERLRDHLPDEED